MEHLAHKCSSSYQKSPRLTFNKNIRVSQYSGIVHTPRPSDVNKPVLVVHYSLQHYGMKLFPIPIIQCILLWSMMGMCVLSIVPAHCGNCHRC